MDMNATYNKSDDMIEYIPNPKLPNLSLAETTMREQEWRRLNPPNDQELSHAAGDCRQPETRSEN